MASEAPAPVAGTWYAPGSSRSQAASVAIDNGRLVVTAEDGNALGAFPLSEATVSDRIGAIPRRITFADGSAFETRDNDGIDRLWRGRARAAGAIASLERFHPRLIVFAAVVVALCFAIYRYAVPVLVEVAVAVTPPVVPQLMSQSVMISLDQAVFDETKLSKARQKALSDAFAGLAAHAPGGAPAYTLHFRRGGAIGPNAFALPDGTIVLTDELVDLAGADDGAIIGVLGHEIGHVAHAHSLRRLYRAAGIATLIMLIGGDIGAGAEDILVQGSALLTLSYSRDQERDADRYGVELMLRAGQDPKGLMRLFVKLQEKFGAGSDSDFLSTHPATKERIEEIERVADELGVQPPVPKGTGG